MFRHLGGKTAFNWCLADTEATKCRKCPGPAPMPPQTTRATEAPLDVSKLVKAIGSQFQGSGTCIWRWHAAAVNQGSLFGLPDEASLELRRFFLKVSLKYSSSVARSSKEEARLPAHTKFTDCNICNYVNTIGHGHLITRCASLWCSHADKQIDPRNPIRFGFHTTCRCRSLCHGWSWVFWNTWNRQSCKSSWVTWHLTLKSRQPFQWASSHRMS